jgi:hypothetical protein
MEVLRTKEEGRPTGRPRGRPYVLATGQPPVQASIGSLFSVDMIVSAT